MKTVDCVECAYCGRLIKADSDTYYLVEGKYRQRIITNYGGAKYNEKNIGTSEDPKVVCLDDDCLLKIFGRERY